MSDEADDRRRRQEERDEAARRSQRERDEAAAEACRKEQEEERVRLRGIRERADSAIQDAEAAVEHERETSTGRADRRIAEERVAAETRLTTEREVFETDLAQQRDLTKSAEARYTAEQVARIAAEAATRARDEFLGVVSHDLKSPLNAIQLSAGVLARMAESSGELGRRVRHSADVILRAASRMRDLVDDLLDVASIEAGRLSIRPEDVRVRGLLDEVEESFAPLAAEKGLAFSVLVRDDLTLRCDRHRVFQAIGNLVGNAIKFTREGSVVIEVNRGDGPHEEAAVVTVRDTGPGIAPELRPRLFERFSHGDHDPRHRGTGLGLFITSGIVKGHGGEIWLSSEVGEGSEFRFTVPLAPSPE